MTINSATKSTLFWQALVSGVCRLNLRNLKNYPCLKYALALQLHENLCDVMMSEESLKDPHVIQLTDDVKTCESFKPSTFQDLLGVHNSDFSHPQIPTAWHKLLELKRPNTGFRFGILCLDGLKMFETTKHVGCFERNKVCSVGYFDPSILGLLGRKATWFFWESNWLAKTMNCFKRRCLPVTLLCFNLPVTWSTWRNMVSSLGICWRFLVGQVYGDFSMADSSELV